MKHKFQKLKSWSNISWIFFGKVYFRPLFQNNEYFISVKVQSGDFPYVKICIKVAGGYLWLSIYIYLKNKLG